MCAVTSRCLAFHNCLVPHFPPPVTRFRHFQSCIFHPCSLVPIIPVSHFQSSQSCVISEIGTDAALPLHQLLTSVWTTTYYWSRNNDGTDCWHDVRPPVQLLSVSDIDRTLGYHTSHDFARCFLFLRFLTFGDFDLKLRPWETSTSVLVLLRFLVRTPCGTGQMNRQTDGRTDGQDAHCG